MGVVRVVKTKDYTVMANTHFKEKNMSLKAKGLLSVMLSLPDEWDYSIKGLVAICKENTTAIRTTLSELEDFGYLKRERHRNEQGTFEYEYTIFETPHTEEPYTENLYTDDPHTDDPHMEEPAAENPLQLNTKQLNTKESNTDDINNIIEYFNLVTGKKYKASTPKTRELIKARMNEGFTVEDFRRVIDKKTSQWNGTKMEKYLRPLTIFGTKFESYLNETDNQERSIVDVMGVEF